MKDNRTKIFILLIAILLIANSVLLVLYFQQSSSNKQHKRQDRKAYIAAFLKKDIGFSQEQLVKYDTLSDNHRKKISLLFDQQRVNKAVQFKQLVMAGFSDSSINTEAEASAATQKNAEVLFITHMKNIRLLCTPQQLPAFDTLFAKVITRRGGDEGRKRSTH